MRIDKANPWAEKTYLIKVSDLEKDNKNRQIGDLLFFTF